VEGDIASFAFLYLAFKIRSLCQLGPPDEKTSAETASWLDRAHFVGKPTTMRKYALIEAAIDATAQATAAA